MGRRGPPAQPTVLKIERGNPGKRALNHDEPELTRASSTKPPASLKGRARKEWVQLADELIEKGVLTVADLTAFETYCQLVGECDTYERLIRRVGRTDAHKLGYAGFLLKLRAQQKQYAAELGLTPSSRSGVKAVKKPDPADAKRRRFFGGSGGSGERASSA